jgi:nucleotide-binding universal stress UspA family protein
MMLKRILVAVDGTASSWRALEYACALVALSKGELIVTTVANENGDKVLNQAHAILDGHKDINTSFVLETGDSPAGKILEVEKRENCDTIVSGSRGLGTLEALLRQSVSQTLLEEADVPLIVVK